MKINEIITGSNPLVEDIDLLTDQKLFEAVDMENDTGLRTDDLVNLIRTRNQRTGIRMTSEEFGKYLENLA